MIHEDSTKQAPIVERRYQAQADACSQALELLLKKPLVRKQTAAHAPDNGLDDGTRIKGGSADAPIIPG